MTPLGNHCIGKNVIIMTKKQNDKEDKQQHTGEAGSACQLRAALAEANRRQAETDALLQATQAVLRLSDFQSTAHSIFDTAKEIIGADSGYVALLSDDGAENEVLFLDAGGRPCKVDPYLPMPIRGLRSEAYQYQKVVYDNDFMHSRWIKFMPAGHVNLDNVLFAPLVDGGKAVGLVGMANKPDGFDDNDAKLAGAFGRLVSIALINSRNHELLKASEERLRIKNQELEEALAQIKSLRGLLPICASCKKIRDDKGYWQSVEGYISAHSDAQFSHGLCPDCVRKLYPDIAEQVLKKKDQ